MMLKDLTVASFVDKLESSDPVPGGGSVAALSASTSAALASMVASLTVGKKNYEAVSEKMEEISKTMNAYKMMLVDFIDKDANSFDGVMQAMKMPKETDEEKAARTAKIQEETKYAAMVPFEVAEKTTELFDAIAFLVEHGNKNAQTDVLVAAMMARTAVLGALYNVKINLGSIKDTVFVEDLTQKVSALEKIAIEKEQAILALTNL